MNTTIFHFLFTYPLIRFDKEFKDPYMEYKWYL